MLKKYGYKAALPVLFLILAFMANTLIYSCAMLNPNTTKGLALSKATAESIAKTAIQMNREGKLSERDLTRVQELYTKGQAAQQIVIESLKMSLELGSNPKTNENYNKALQSYAIIIQQLLDLAIQLKLVK
jgi:heterodisulfide reductase subunit C